MVLEEEGLFRRGVSKAMACFPRLRVNAMQCSPVTPASQPGWLLFDDMHDNIGLRTLMHTTESISGGMAFPFLIPSSRLSLGLLGSRPYLFPYLYN